MMPLLAAFPLNSLFYRFLDHFQASYTSKILVEAIRLLGQLWPYLLLGILASTIVKLYISKQRMAGFFSKTNNHASILLAALIGTVNPLGSYVIIPMSAALLGIGVPLPVLMALMVASPLMNPNLFILTAGAMGLEMAILRTLSAFLLGAFAGYTALWMSKGERWYRGGTVLRDQTFSMDKFTGRGTERTFAGFLRELYKMSLFVGKYFFLAILLAAVIKIAVNPKYIVRLFDSDSFLSVALSTGAGVPFYVCGGAAIPVVQQLADLGMSKGAVLAFFISGPVTRISNLVILQAAFRRTVLLHYLLTGILGAMIFGFLYNLI